jgi:hypothetical protein
VSHKKRAKRPPARPVYRVAVRKRRPRGIADSLDMSLSGRTWSWWCNCDAIPRHAPAHELALAAGLVHLTNVHHERGPR